MKNVNLTVDLAGALTKPAALSKPGTSKPASRDFADRMRRAIHQPSKPEPGPAKPAKPGTTRDQDQHSGTDAANDGKAPTVLELAMQALAGQQGANGATSAAERIIEGAIETLAGKGDPSTLVTLLTNAANALKNGSTGGKIHTAGDLAALLQAATEQQTEIVGNAVLTLTAGSQDHKPALDMQSLLTMLRLRDQAAPSASLDPSGSQQTPGGLLATLAQAAAPHAHSGAGAGHSGQIVGPVNAADTRQPGKPQLDAQPVIAPFAAQTAVNQAKPLTEAAAVTARQVVDQLAAPINARLDAGGSSEFQVTLRPDSLGTVGITVKVEHGAVHVQLVVDDRARDLVQAGLPDLRNAIRQGDSRDLQVEVMLRSGGGFDGGSPYSRGSHQQAARPRGGRGVAAIDAGPDTAINESRQATSARPSGLGLVDYRI